MPDTSRALLTNTIREAAYLLHGSKADYDPLIDLVGDARFVLLGEASHGTHEFYNARAEITRLYWLLGSSVQNQALRDGERSPFPACQHRRVGLQSDVINSMLMLERRSSHLWRSFCSGRWFDISPATDRRAAGMRSPLALLVGRDRSGPPCRSQSEPPSGKASLSSSRKTLFYENLSSCSNGR
jgi:hypothetical protein